MPRIPRLSRYCVLVQLSLLFALSAMHPFVSGTCAAPPPAGPNPTTLWQQAEASRKEGKLAKAVELYQLYHEKFLDSAKAEEALWQAAQASRQLNLDGKAPDWEKTAELFRLFTIDFPRSARAAEAHFEMASSLYRMRRFREALSYFSIFGKKYPNSPLLLKVYSLQADTLLLLGRLQEARALFRKIEESATDEFYKGKAMLGLGDTQAAGGDYAGALAAYSAVAKQFPEFHLRDPELLRKLGNTLLAAGKEEEGRTALHHYLNLAEKSSFTNEVLFALAESYRRSADGITALKLYEWIIKGEGVEEEILTLSRFRQAEYYDNPARKLPRWQKRIDPADPAGDKPFLDVLDLRQNDPISQDARRALFLRYQARKDFESAYETGRAYLRNSEAGKKDPFAEQILVFLAENFLAKKEYEKLYRLYVDEYRHVSGIENGRFLLLVGKALEAMGLYEQAATVYFRAQGLSLSDQDKAELYFRRTEVALLLKDWKAADRLLVFLRGIYRNRPEIAEVYYLSGRLAEARGAAKEALDYYGKAVLSSAPPAKKSLYGGAQLRMLFFLKLYSQAAQILERFRRNQTLAPELLQDWQRRLGDALLGRNEPQALAAYQEGVGKGMPENTRAAQLIHLQLAEVAMRRGAVEEGRASLAKAKAGPNPLLKKKAQERLNQLEIDRVVQGTPTR